MTSPPWHEPYPFVKPIDMHEPPIQVLTPALDAALPDVPDEAVFLKPEQSPIPVGYPSKFWKDRCEAKELELNIAVDTVTQLQAENLSLRATCADLRSGRTIQHVIDESRP